MNGNWIFWVVIFWWVIPMVMRKMRQSGPGTGRPPYPQDRRGPDGQGQYPQGQYPGYPQTQAPPPYPQDAQGQLPEGQGTAAQGQPGVPWWQQPLPPGFPGQPAPQAQPGAPTQQTQPAPRAQRAPEPVEAGAPDDAPQGYRAKKLAELDRQFSEQKISLEEYMKARNEVMRG